MESPCLSILVPLLVKGLREKTPVIRKTAIIIDNMVKVSLSNGPFVITDEQRCMMSERQSNLGIWCRYVVWPRGPKLRIGHQGVPDTKCIGRLLHAKPHHCVSMDSGNLQLATIATRPRAALRSLVMLTVRILMRTWHSRI